MLAGMPSAMLSEWMAFAAVEPFGEERNDFRLAYALAIIVNMFRGKDTQPVTPLDLMPRVGALAGDVYVPEPVGMAATPAPHPGVQAFEEMYRQWEQSQI